MKEKICYNGKMDKILAGLNPEQQEAVETLSGPVLILAGAGSGKTKTLTHRIANLIAHGLDPSNILAVTFTNKAAREMRERLWRLLKPDGWDFPPHDFMPFMGTFHGIAVRILRQDGMAVAVPPDFVIYDVDDQVTLIKRVIKEAGIKLPTSLKPKMIQSMISSAKNQGQLADDFAAGARFPDMKLVAKVFKQYEREKDRAGALDFDDLMLRELKLLQKFPEIRERWQRQFQQILIDEYQDTNAVQYQIVRLLVGPERNICAVGDDWQSIYSWRGADFTNILNFEQDFPGAKVIKLERNYRSTGNILAAAQKVIRNNQTRTDKNLFTEAGKGEPVRVEGLQNEEAEAIFVASTISLMETQPEYRDYANFAILYRTNAQSYAFEKVFMNMHIPYKIIGGVRFYDRREVKDMLALLRLVENQRDKVSLERVTKNVLKGIGDVSLGRVLGAMDGMEGEEPLLDPDLPEVLTTAKAKKGLESLAGFLRKAKAGLKPLEVVQLAIKHFDFEGITEAISPEEAEERMRNLEVLEANVAEYDSLAEFLADAALMSGADENAGRNAVTLMTIHAAKGLEFPVVFLVGMEEGLFPSPRAIGEGNLEEERRLAYVAMTRAMRQLIISFARSRYAFGGRTFNVPSQFLHELGIPMSGQGGKLDLDGDGFVDSELKFLPEKSAGMDFQAGFRTGSQQFRQSRRPNSSARADDDWMNDIDFGNDFDEEFDEDPFPDDLPVFE